MDAREQRGLQIAALARIDREGDYYIVPSQTNPRPTRYKVSVKRGNQTCTCPDFETRGSKCKHIFAVEYTLKREQNPDGSETVTESVTFTQKKTTYAQDWPAYNAAQTNEKRKFQSLLHDLCKGLPQPIEGKPRKGRPALPLADSVFATVFKVYSTFSGRRFTSDLCDAQAKGYISPSPILLFMCRRRCWRT